MKKWFCVVAVLVTAVSALPAYTTNYACTGTVTYLGVDSNDNGVIVVGGPGGLPDIGLCSLSQAGRFTTDACKGIYATLLAAKLSGQTITINFSDSLTCSTQPAWGGPDSTSAWFVSTQ